MLKKEEDLGVDSVVEQLFPLMPLLSTLLNHPPEPSTTAGSSPGPPSRAPLGIPYHSQSNMLGLRYKFVNFEEGRGPGSR